MPNNSENDRLWLALYLVPKLGIAQFHRLIHAFQSPEIILNTSPEKLRKKARIKKETADSIPRALNNPFLEKEWDIVRKNRIRIVHLDSPQYPALLRQVYLPPPVMYCRGSLAPPDRLCVSVVGTRNPSGSGQETAYHVAHHLAQQGITVVSGFARGIDTAALQGSLQASGHTVSVLGNGLEVIYPRENESLINKIDQQGALLSEFPMHTPPRPKNFPRRNRIISGISVATIIVEAPEKSGALITARFAMEQGRDVYAVPGNINGPQHVGSNTLIRDGAKILLDPSEILEELQLRQTGNPEKDVSATHAPSLKTGDTELPELILDILTGTPSIHVDEIARVTMHPIQQVLSILMILELENKITQEEFMMFRLKD